MNRESDVRGGDGIGWWQLAGVALVAVVVASALAVAPGATVAQSGSNNTTFIVQQGSQCTQVTPLGNGTKTVEDFYDYQILNRTANYSSLGTVDIQENQTSQVFVYDGSDGLSLVFLSDKINLPGGFVATADVSGLPTDGDWAVEDDNYTHRDDSFKYNATGAHIDWNSNGERTDGAAFRGLDSPNYTTIAVSIKFNQRAEQYPFDEWNGSPAHNRIERWIVRSGTGKTTQLDMNRSIQISPGTCRGGVSTFTATQASGSNATNATAGTSGTTTAPTAATTRTTTSTATTRTATGSPTPTTTASSSTTTAAGGAGGNETATQASSGGNGGGGNTSNESESGGNGGSGAFGPGFGVVVALVAVLLAVTAFARRKD